MYIKKAKNPYLLFNVCENNNHQEFCNYKNISSSHMEGRFQSRCNGGNELTRKFRTRHPQEKNSIRISMC